MPVIIHEYIKRIVICDLAGFAAERRYSRLSRLVLLISLDELPQRDGCDWKSAHEYLSLLLDRFSETAAMIQRVPAWYRAPPAARGSGHPA